MAAHSADKSGSAKRRALAVCILLGCAVGVLLLMVYTFGERGEGRIALHRAIIPQDSIAGNTHTPSVVEVAASPLQATPATPLPTASPLPIQTALIRVAGDLMVHEKQYLSSQIGENSYDFTPCFASVAPLLSRADLAIGNLETTIAGGGYSGFPSFRSPVEYLDALREAGFDVLTFANNHTYDGGSGGIERTIAAMEERDILSTGAFAQRQQGEGRALVIDVNGIRVGILAYADMRFNAPAWQINTLASLDTVREDVRIARGLGAEVLLVMVHWGAEYAPEESGRQREYAKELSRMGVDVILGSHPHVVQRSEWIETQMSDGQSKKSYVIYSLGNFISNQKPTDNNGRAPVDGGLVLDIQLEKHVESGEVRITAIEPVPTMVLRRDKGGGMYSYDVLPIESVLLGEADLPEEMELTDNERRRMQTLLDRIKGICPVWAEGMATDE